MWQSMGWKSATQLSDLKKKRMVGLRHGSGKPLSRLSARQEGSPPWPHGMGTLLRRWATQSVLLKSTTLASDLLRPVLFTEATGQLVASWCFACRVSRPWRGRGHWAYGQQKLTVERMPVKSKHHQPVLLISVSLCFGKAERINSPHVLFMPSLQSLATTGPFSSWWGRRVWTPCRLGLLETQPLEAGSDMLTGAREPFFHSRIKA